MMSAPNDDANNPKLILLKKFFIFNAKYGLTEEEVSFDIIRFIAIRIYF